MAGRSRKGQPLFVVIAGGALVLLRQLGLVFGDSHQKPSNFASFPVHIINLKRDTERWRRVSAEFAEKNVPSQLVHRLDAVSGKDLSKEELASKSTRCARLFCTRGTIGCYLSHKAFWDIVAAADEHDDDDDDEHEVDYRMVCEDDVVLADDDFYRRVQSLVREMETNGDPEWDVLLLGGLGCVHPDASRHGPYYRFAAWVTGGVRRPRRVTEHWHVPRRPFGAHAYLLSRRGARELARRAGRASYHVDCVAWGLPERDLRLYCCDPLLVFQDATTPTTLGGVTSGVETWIPKRVTMDGYTRMSLEWVFNEPFLRLPLVDAVVTNGRYAVIGVLGGLLGLWRWIRVGRPWALAAHLTTYVLFAFGFTRYMTRPAP